MSVEHAVAKFMMRGLTYKPERQALMNMGDWQVDELVFAAKKPNEENWTLTKRFYFDITIGFYRPNI